MLEDYLATCGLHSSEISVLLYLVRQGAAQAQRIAKATGLKRANVYAVLQNLINYGLVTKQPRKKVTFFCPVPAEMIPRVLEQQAKKRFDEIHTATALMSSQLIDLSKQARRHFVGFEVSTVESREAVMLELESLLLGGHFCAIFNPQLSLPDDFKPMISKYLRASAIESPPIREIMVPGPDTEWYRARIKNKNHLVKIIPEDRVILSDMIFHQDTVTLLHYEAGSEVAFRIRHEDFYRSMMTTFDLLWESLP